MRDNPWLRRSQMLVASAMPTSVKLRRSDIRCRSSGARVQIMGYATNMTLLPELLPYSELSISPLLTRGLLQRAANADLAKATLPKRRRILSFNEKSIATYDAVPGDRDERPGRSREGNRFPSRRGDEPGRT